LTTNNMQTCRSFGVVRTPFQILAIMHLLDHVFSRSTITFGRLIRSAMMQITLRAAIKALSELLMFHLF
jgi:hypothetical protein